MTDEIQRTLPRYLDLLELVFVIKRIPAWSFNLTTRAICTPNLIVTDSGLRVRLIGTSDWRASSPGPRSRYSCSTTATATR
jgi:predicted AAA+ superfamily ATPase